MRSRETRRPSEIVHAERLRVARVDHVLGPQEMTLRGNDVHGISLRETGVAPAGVRGTSGDEQTKAELGRLGVEEVAVPFGPPT
jgi:hypothetical protein